MARLPSTMGLLAFAAASRHLSFVKAAEELNVTPGAVSRQIQSLEGFLGARLFQRHHRRVELTPLGRDYLGEIHGPLERLQEASARLRQDSRSGALSICAYPTFAIRWFIPRWGRFYDRHPDVDVRLTTSLNPVDFARDDYDLAVQVLPDGQSRPGLAAHKLLEVDTFPVCHPNLAGLLHAPGDLANLTLLHGAPRPWDWQRWLTAVGAAEVDASQGLRFESMNLAIQAALEGLGVAIGIEALIGDDLAAGRLVRPFSLGRRSGRPFCLVYPDAKADNPNLIAFRDWLLEEAEAEAA